MGSAGSLARMLWAAATTSSMWMVVMQGSDGRTQVIWVQGWQG